MDHAKAIGGEFWPGLWGGAQFSIRPQSRADALGHYMPQPVCEPRLSRARPSWPRRHRVALGVQGQPG